MALFSAAVAANVWDDVIVACVSVVVISLVVVVDVVEMFVVDVLPAEVLEETGVVVLVDA